MESAEETEAALPDACGCYAFAIKHGDNIVTWYVGKTGQKTFRFECFQPTKINYYNEALASHSGTPLLFLLPRLTAAGKKFSKPTSGKYKDIDYLEKMLIGMALESNRELFNVRGTKMLRKMVVPGIINSPIGAPTQPQRDLKRALGLHT